MADSNEKKSLTTLTIEMDGTDYVMQGGGGLQPGVPIPPDTVNSAAIQNDAVKMEDNSSAYTVFQIWGVGRTVKLQCDLSAMISPEHFREYVLDSLKEQSKHVDNVLYHLDGPDAIRHLDALMEVDGIKALQWTSGDAGPDGTLPDWDVIYDKAIAAGKSIWVKVYSGDIDDWIKNCERLVMKYGSHSIFFLFPEMSHDYAVKLLDYAEKHWSDIKGTYIEQLETAKRG